MNPTSDCSLLFFDQQLIELGKRLSHAVRENSIGNAILQNPKVTLTAIAILIAVISYRIFCTGNGAPLVEALHPRVNANLYDVVARQAMVAHGVGNAAPQAGVLNVDDSEIDEMMAAARERLKPLYAALGL